MTFWGVDLSKNTQGDPKRKFRWKISFGGMGGETGIVWFAKSATKPELTVSNDATHKFLGHTFKFPGSVSWNDIDVTLVDPVSPDAAEKTLGIIHNAGYRVPETQTVLQTISKDKSVDALKTVVIEQLNGDGESVERWELHNAFLSKVGFGDLSYEDDALSEISLTITYDWAKWGKKQDSAGIFTESYNPQ